MNGIHCPRCGQQQASYDTRFCSRCGFTMNGLAEIVAKGGLPPEMFGDGKTESPRKRGVKQGALLMLSSLIIVPLLAIISATLDIHPAVVAVTAVVTFWGGLLRILYALIFETGKPTAANVGFVESVRSNLTGKSSAPAALPPQQSQPAHADFQPAPGNWRDTNDLQPVSVTEETTRTLDRSKLDEN